METLESITNSNALTPLEKQVEEKLLTGQFSPEQQKDIFRLLFKFAGRYSNIKHWVEDTYLNLLLEEAEQYL